MREIKSDIEKININIPASRNEILQKTLDKVNTNEQIKTIWYVSNVNAIERLGMTDHGPVHFQIVANIALKIARLLKKSGIELSIQKNFGLPYEYGELVIFLASISHDFGMSVNRKGHEEYSLIIADRILHDLLDHLSEIERTIVVSETLHSIISHRKDGTPYTIEAGILRIADALDMSEGRSRMPYEQGKVDIHAVSAQAIDSVEIVAGTQKPIQVNITMNNSAGIFQVDELLKSKLHGSGLEKYVGIVAEIKNEQEKSIVKEFLLD